MTRAAADALVVEGHSHFQHERFAEAAAQYERAVTVFPQHPLAWKGLGHAMLCLGRPDEAARAFDQAIGLAQQSATALWGGALAHAELGHKVIAKNYLTRALDLQPTWIAMARDVPSLSRFLRMSVRGEELLTAAFGAFSKRAFRHAAQTGRAIEIARVSDKPARGLFTYLTVGLADAEWNDPARPRIELVLASTVEHEVCGQILANLAFHLSDIAFYPQPGTMVRDVVGGLGAGDLSERLPHVYVQSPRAWGLELPLDEGPPAITLAQVFPISEAEYQMWRGLGSERFERGLADRKVEVADLRRSGL